MAILWAGLVNTPGEGLVVLLEAGLMVLSGAGLGFLLALRAILVFTSLQLQRQSKKATLRPPVKTLLPPVSGLATKREDELQVPWEQRP